MLVWRRRRPPARRDRAPRGECRRRTTTHRRARTWTAGGQAGETSQPGQRRWGRREADRQRGEDGVSGLAEAEVTARASSSGPRRAGPRAASWSRSSMAPGALHAHRSRPEPAAARWVRSTPSGCAAWTSCTCRAMRCWTAPSPKPSLAPPGRRGPGRTDQRRPRLRSAASPRSDRRSCWRGSNTRAGHRPRGRARARGAGTRASVRDARREARRPRRDGRAGRQPRGARSATSTSST